MSDIEVGQKFISRNGANIAVVVYLSANGDVGYRLKFTRRIRHATEKNFRLNYKPLNDAPPARELLVELDGKRK